ncbi:MULTISPECIES: heavy-metal-associated domain-containing protein [Curtobacterium]|jgi:copper chaperone|uniref:Heavy-metal-associated domain-containing protein n=1 Tax=Curtobacterium flaccumfaciens pv. flaccumfaciens TaxID=138532 RepID=A0A9Q2ZNM9_9MICO|nr:MULTISPECIES: heavy-metal-associated domain-containing protein [Curtobacterium]EYT63007.1 copper-transporting ATPase [Curtobacterium flaccumfaciens UCD-AKU]KIQ08212.1 copper-transporting ATPase [Curtobacterium flaccumfaciens]KQR32717.1 copper-transporting ATPase [Curtobacterium sp. Leaf154]MBF4596202.1 heavy-metal-associated domain-containing protein [Curtobacterium sp. VKM Ac-1796]MBF4611318.1 heavy-metal-associated domain-containing protein [Curtobacterium sp. VKM Ac-2889]
MERFEYHVVGMTCEHCERRVTGELEAIAGVELVTADAATGLVVVTAPARPDAAAIAEAVDEAGYELAGA